MLYCLTDEMVGDFYTRPLQVTPFIKHRNTIFGINEDDIPLYEEAHTQYIMSLMNIDKSRTRT